MLRQERNGSIMTVYLARPDQRNAMTGDLVKNLIAVMRACDHDDAVGAVILAGEGKGFCAGSDLADLARMPPADRVEFEANSGLLARMISQCGKPVIAAVHGFAIGGGMTLAAACDIVLTSTDAKWSMPEVPIGLFPAWGIGAIMDRTGLPLARRLCWGIDILSGKEAVDCGLADELASDPLQAAYIVAERLADLPKFQARAVKRFFSAYVAHEQADVQANRVFLDATNSPEAAASFNRFGRPA
ncbi:MAG: enoyl-CoA hydratase/isomerase family protein [Sphingobium sp.]